MAAAGSTLMALSRVMGEGLVTTALLAFSSTSCAATSLPTAACSSA